MKPTPTLFTPSALLLFAWLCAATAFARQPEPQQPPTPPGEVEAAATVSETGETNAISSPEEPDASSTNQNEEPRVYSGVHREAVISIGRSVEIKADESAETVVVIGGSAKIDGRVAEAVVVIGGDIEMNGEAGDTVVAVLGNLTVGDSARVGGDVVSVGGLVNRAPGARIGGELQQVDLGGIGLPQLEWLRSYLVHCILKLRPLAPQVGWAWAVAGVVFLLYLLAAVLFPKPVQACVDQLTARPATTLLLGVLTKILAPIVILLLTATGFGVIVVPFLIAALFLFAIVGKIALLEAIGMQFGRQMGADFLKNPVPALLLGILVLVVLYIIPVVGYIVFFGTAVWGLGCAVGAAFAGIRRELPPPKPRLRTPVAYVPPSGQATVPAAAQPAATPEPSITLTAVTESSAAAPDPAATPSVALVPSAPPQMPEILAFARAGFWERLGAGFLDMVLVLLASSLVGGAPLGFLVALAYFAGMWAWRQTTVGGIVLGLKVAREDGQDLSFPVCLVRSLFAGFSMMVLFLGFFWIAWDREKQGWHDKIAGTVVLKVPRSTPLVMF